MGSYFDRAMEIFKGCESGEPRDKKCWDKAKAAVRKQYPDLSEDDEKFWKLANGIYATMTKNKPLEKATINPGTGYVEPVPAPPMGTPMEYETPIQLGCEGKKGKIQKAVEAILKGKEPVKNPGVRGGKGYYDDKGVWQYGERPGGEQKTQQHARKEFHEAWENKYGKEKPEKKPPSIIKINTDNVEDMEKYFSTHGLPKIDDVIELKGGVRVTVTQIQERTINPPFEGKQLLHGGRVVRVWSSSTGNSWDLYLYGLNTDQRKKAKTGEWWAFPNDDIRRKTETGWEQWDNDKDQYVEITE